MSERETVAETLRSFADQIESGGLDSLGPFVWQNGQGLAQLGATGDYPGGSLDDDDEGGLQLAIGRKDDKVIVNFGKPIGWLAMGNEEAAKFALFLMKQAGFRFRDWFSDVLDFRKAMALELNARPTMLSGENVELLTKCLKEEIGEFEEACSHDDLPEIADALVDLIYYAIGAAQAFGFDIREVWEEVQAANMRKLGGPKRADGKQLKPEGWKPPDVKAALERGRELIEPWGNCKKCGTEIDFRGWCKDSTCPYSSRFQHESYAEG